MLGLLSQIIESNGPQTHTVPPDQKEDTGECRGNYNRNSHFNGWVTIVWERYVSLPGILKISCTLRNKTHGFTQNLAIEGYMQESELVISGDCAILLWYLITSPKSFWYF